MCLCCTPVVIGIMGRIAGHRLGMRIIIVGIRIRISAGVDTGVETTPGWMHEPCQKAKYKKGEHSS